MRGLDRIIDMRRRGLKPAAVTLFPWTPGPIDYPTWVHWEPNDIPELTDLRPLVGLFVAVTGDCDIAKRWGRAAARAGAWSVLTLDGQNMRALRLEGVDQ